MAAYDLEEQEQLAEIKAWWKQYGNLLTNVLLAAVLAVMLTAGATDMKALAAEEQAVEMVVNSSNPLCPVADSFLK